LFGPLDDGENQLATLAAAVRAALASQTIATAAGAVIAMSSSATPCTCGRPCANAATLIDRHNTAAQAEICFIGSLSEKATTRGASQLTMKRV
ncbi:MAG: hypothetical protein K2Y02_05945, partial [Burkholderiaceae bacterium]|nr:hypothetical protein [Burkholderiaceae bacterium]